jgi:ABC-2 type transport system permease protein
MATLANLTRNEARLLVREPLMLFMTLVLPIVILLAFGLPDFARQPSPDLGGQRAIDTVLPSVALAIAIGILAVFSVPSYLASYREKGVLRRLSTTPANPLLLLIAQLVVSMAVALVSLALVLGVGLTVLGMAAPRSIPWLTAVFVLGSASLFAVGLIVAAVAPSARVAAGLGWLAFFPLAFLAGMYLPRNLMPDLLARIGDFTPMAAFREAVQAAWVGATPHPLHLVVMAATTVLAAAVAAKLFRWE